MDFAGYWEHRLLHAVPVFWRLHALHHSDTDLDVASFVRHHPLEVILQALLDALVVISFGLPALSVALFAAITTVVQMLAHGNIELPAGLRLLSLFLVTPEFADVKFQRFDQMLLLPLLISGLPVAAPQTD